MAAIPTALVRNNIVLPAKTQKKTEFENSFGRYSVEGKKNITESDYKVLIAVINVIYNLSLEANTSIRHSSEEFLKLVSEEGIKLKLSDIRKQRGFTKASKNYKKIIEALTNLKKTAITTESFWANPSKEVEKVNHLYSFVDEVTYTKEENCFVFVKLNKFLIYSLREKEGYFPFLCDRKILNSAKGLEFNLYLYLCSQFVSPTKKRFSLHTIIKNTNLLLFSTVSSRKREAKRKIVSAMESLRKKGVFFNFFVHESNGGLSAETMFDIERKKENENKKKI